MFKWFRANDSLLDAARGSDRQKFARLFLATDLKCICLPEQFAEGLPSNASQAEVLAQMEAAAKDLSERTEFRPFMYGQAGQTRMPLFTHDDHAAEFAKVYASHTRRIIPLQLLGVAGAALITSFAECDFVVLNDRTKTEYILSQADVTLLKEMA